MPPYPTPSVPGFERSLAVVIGINAYSQGVPVLHNAVRDATAVADTLECQGFEVIRLIDAQASLEALNRLVTHRLPGLQPSLDRLVIYFAGHGLAHTDEEQQLSGFLLPADARRDVPSSYWPMTELRKALRQLSCRHLLLILDCCFAGAFPHAAVRDLRPAPTSTPLYLERFRHFTSHRSFQLLLSTAHDEVASDRLLAKPSQETLGDGQHSPFAQALLQGLEPRSPADFNHDGLLTASELYTFLRDKLVSLVPSHQQQTPSLWNLDWHDGGEFLFNPDSSLPELPSAAPLSKDFNPYLGLRPFSASHRQLFFGRERSIDALCEHLLKHPLLVLSGPSGAGKSSLVHAGLLPRLSDCGSWVSPPSLRPSAHPLHALSSWLTSVAPGTEAPSAAALSAQPEAAKDFLLSILSQRSELHLLLVVDPLEELVTACPDKHRRAAFLRALARLLQVEHPRLRVVMLLRSDFEPHVLSLLSGSLFPSALWHANRITVPPMNRDELRRCIEKPAEARTLFFASGLVDRVLDDVEQMPGALPLLSVALSELFDAYLESGREDRTLTCADYERLGGGIAGALQRRAELIFLGAPPPIFEGAAALPALPYKQRFAFQRTLRDVLLRMSSPEGGEPSRRRVRRAELDYPTAEENVLVQRALLTLEASRLIVASDDGGPCVEPAHDALLTAWPRLHEWVRHAQRDLLLLRRISHAAAEWTRHQGATDFLWTDGRLDQLGLSPASLLHENIPVALASTTTSSQYAEPLAFNAEESAFLRASARRSHSLRRRRHSIQFMATASILLLALVAVFYALRANEAAKSAEENRQEALEERNQAKEAKERAEDSAVEAEHQRVEAEKQRRAALDNEILAVIQKVFADINAKIAESERRKAEEQTLIAHEEQLAAQASSEQAQEQKKAAVKSEQQAQWHRKLALDYAAKALEQQQAAVAYAKAALENREAALSYAEKAQENARAAREYAQQAQEHAQAAIDSEADAVRQRQLADQRTLQATVAQAEAARNARLEEAQRLRAEAEEKLAVYSRLLAKTENLSESDPMKAALLLQEALRTMPPGDTSWHQTFFSLRQQEVSEADLHGLEHSTPIPPVFSPDGKQVFALEGMNIHLWRTDGMGEERVLTGAENSLYYAAFRPGEFPDIVAQAANHVLFWQAGSTEAILLLWSDPTAVLGRATFDQHGSRLLLTNGDTLLVWRMSDPYSPPLKLKGSVASLTSAAFNKDGSLILTNASDGTVLLWNADGADRPTKLLPPPSGHVFWAQFSPDGSHIVALSGKEILLWDTRKLLQRTGQGCLPHKLVDSQADFLISAAFNTQGNRILATSSDGRVFVWNLMDKNPDELLSAPPHPLRFARFSPDGLHVVALTTNSAQLWDLTKKGPANALPSTCDYMKSAQFSPMGDKIATLCLDGTATLWSTDLTKEPLILSTAIAPINSITFNPNRESPFVVTNSGNVAQVWRTDVLAAPRILKGHTQDVQHVVFDATGERLLTTSGNSIRVWKTRPKDSVQFPNIDTPAVAAAALSPDTSLLLTTGYNSGVLLWKVKENTRVEGFEIDSDMKTVLAEFSSDGTRILTTSLDKARYSWPIQGGKSPIVLPPADKLPENTILNTDELTSTWGFRTLHTWPEVGFLIESANNRAPPIKVSQPGLIAAFFFDQGQKFATLSRHELIAWPIAPALMLSSLKTMTTACLSRDERISFLQEDAATADANFWECEHSHERNRPRVVTQNKPWNSNNDPVFFVNQLYLDLLERAPTPSELSAHLESLASCLERPSCLATSRLLVASTVFESAEHCSFQNLNLGATADQRRYITRAYTGFLRRRPEGTGEYFLNVLFQGPEDRLKIISEFISSSAYRERFGVQ